MKPIFVCQLPQEEQQMIQTMLTNIILHGCGGGTSNVQEYYGISLEEAVQLGMDSKITDLDYLLTFYADEYHTINADEEFHIEDTQSIAVILRESRKHETDNPIAYANSRTISDAPEQEDEWER